VTAVPGRAQGPLPGATLAAGFGLVVTLALSAAAVKLGFGERYVAGALAVYLPIVAVALALVRRHHPHPRFGAPNAITTFRVSLTAQLGGAVADAGQLATPALAGWQWAAAGIVVLALALDGLDGRLARRARLTSPFGARYDMEVDAAMILVAATLAFLLGKAGVWVLALGAIRYLFVVAGLLLPWLAAPLPPSFRRKAICAVQYTALCALLVPVVPPSLADAVAALSLSLLVYSFAVDVLWLARHRR
jgi:phosphatidylglycerophosphate synthase